MQYHKQLEAIEHFEIKDRMLTELNAFDGGKSSSSQHLFKACGKPSEGTITIAKAMSLLRDMKKN